MYGAPSCLQLSDAVQTHFVDPGFPDPKNEEVWTNQGGYLLCSCPQDFILGNDGIYVFLFGNLEQCYSFDVFW